MGGVEVSRSLFVSELLDDTNIQLFNTHSLLYMPIVCWIRLPNPLLASKWIYLDGHLLVLFGSQSINTVLANQTSFRSLQLQKIHLV